MNVQIGIIRYHTITDGMKYITGLNTKCGMDKM